MLKLRSTPLGVRFNAVEAGLQSYPGPGIERKAIIAKTRREAPIIDPASRLS